MRICTRRLWLPNAQAQLQAGQIIAREARFRKPIVSCSATLDRRALMRSSRCALDGLCGALSLPIALQGDTKVAAEPRVGEAPLPGVGIVEHLINRERFHSGPGRPIVRFTPRVHWCGIASPFRNHERNKRHAEHGSHDGSDQITSSWRQLSLCRLRVAV